MTATGTVGEAPLAVPDGLYRIEIDGGKPDRIDDFLVEEGQQRRFTWKRSASR